MSVSPNDPLNDINISVMTLYGVRSAQHTESYSAATTCAQCLNITTYVSNIILVRQL